MAQILIFYDFFYAFDKRDGYLLAHSITPSAPADQPDRLKTFARSSNAQRIQHDVRNATNNYQQVGLSKAEHGAWVDVYVAFWKVANAIVDAEEVEAASDARVAGKQRDAERSEGTVWARVYDAWKEVVNMLVRGYSNGAFPWWTVPCLYVAGKYLRTFASRADQEAARVKGSVTFNAGFQDDVVSASERNDKLEDAARAINRIFSLCINDRAPVEKSRKWATYYFSNLLFKTYFKLNSISLCKNILRSLQATSATDMPPLSAFPKSHIATFEYYVGVIHFLEEDYSKAETHLEHAYTLCTSPSASSPRKNIELILTYLIPTRLLTSHKLPTSRLLAPYPALQRLFGPLCGYVKKGDLAGFDAALASGQDDFVKRRIYLTLERGRDVALRNLFRKVYLAGGFEKPPPSTQGGNAGDVNTKLRRTRVPVAEFIAAIRVGLGMRDAEPEAHGVGRDEVECWIANLIYKGLIKGYISRAYEMVVLSKHGNAFPGTGV